MGASLNIYLGRLGFCSQCINDLKEISPNKTEVVFMYEMATDHWLVNKKIVAGRVFSDLRDSILALFSKVEEQATFL